LRLKKTLSHAGSLIIALIFGFSLFVFITVLSNWGSGVPSVFGYSFLNVGTPSMEPAYAVGSVVITKKVDFKELAVGDVISFYSEDPAIYGKPNTHRIVSIGNGEESKIFFETKGDNNPVADRYKVYEDKVIGRVEGSVHSLGKTLAAVKNRYVLFFLLIVPLAAVVFFEIKHLQKVLKSDEEATTPEGITQKSETADEMNSSVQDSEDIDLLEKINRIQEEIDRLTAKQKDLDGNE